MAADVWTWWANHIILNVQRSFSVNNVQNNIYVNKETIIILQNDFILET